MSSGAQSAWTPNLAHMSAFFQITIDCADPDRMARFWAAALRYELQRPPEGYRSWREYWVDVGVPEEETGEGFDAIVDPEGHGPRVWFQQVPESKTVKNRLHFDVLVGGGRSVPLHRRRSRVNVEADRLEALGATVLRVMDTPEIEHYAIAMADPEGNEFDIV